jgi:hypothetical protein
MDSECTQHLTISQTLTGPKSDRRCVASPTTAPLRDGSIICAAFRSSLLPSFCDGRLAHHYPLAYPLLQLYDRGGWIQLLVFSEGGDAMKRKDIERYILRHAELLRPYSAPRPVSLLVLVVATVNELACTRNKRCSTPISRRR